MAWVNWRSDICVISIVSVCWLIFTRDNSGYGLSQWKKTLPCNASSHWLSLYQNDPCLVPPGTIVFSRNSVKMWIYCKISNISCIKSQNLNNSRLVLQLSLPSLLKPSVKNEDVVVAAPTGNALTTSEWSTILLPTKVYFILEVWQ